MARTTPKSRPRPTSPPGELNGLDADGGDFSDLGDIMPPPEDAPEADSSDDDADDADNEEDEEDDDGPGMNLFRVGNPGAKPSWVIAETAEEAAVLAGREGEDSESAPDGSTFSDVPEYVWDALEGTTPHTVQAGVIAPPEEPVQMWRLTNDIRLVKNGQVHALKAGRVINPLNSDLDVIRLAGGVLVQVKG